MEQITTDKKLYLWQHVIPECGLLFLADFALQEKFTCPYCKRRNIDSLNFKKIGELPNKDVVVKPDGFCHKPTSGRIRFYHDTSNHYFDVGPIIPDSCEEPTCITTLVDKDLNWHVDACSLRGNKCKIP
jgi:hypothetical protein